jgi:tryptophanyl-tRNA synthetase
LAADMELFVAPKRALINETLNNDQLIKKVAKMGAEKANESANKTMQSVRELIGIKKFY